MSLNLEKEQMRIIKASRGETCHSLVWQYFNLDLRYIREESLLTIGHTYPVNS